MKAAQMGMVLFLLVGLQCFGQETGKGVGKITVRLLNGKNGKPIKHEVPNIWLGDAKSPNNPLADKGEVTIEIGDTQPREIRVLPNYYADCRFKGDSNKGSLVKYSLDEIASKGVIAENLCGEVHAAPIPRVLVLYVRSRTLKELWAL